MVALSGLPVLGYSQAPPADQRETAATVEEIMVTGTRIRRPSGADAPVPVTVIGVEDIQLSGRPNVADVVRELPALGQGTNLSGVTANDAGGVQGLNLLDLRRLGVERTLVLVDGRRHVGSQAGNTAVDISTIPTALVERIEVMTGGASAVYGADAVSGVVNFILKDRFEGFQFDAQSGLSYKGDAFEHHYSLTTGTNFQEGRGNVTFSASYTKLDPLRATRRSYPAAELFFQSNPANTGPGDGNAANITTRDNRFIFPTPGGLIGIPLANPANARCNNTLPVGPFGSNPRDFYTIDEETLELRCFEVGAPTGSPVIKLGGDGLRTNELELLRSGLEKTLIHTGFNFDLSPGLTAFASGKYASTQANAVQQPVFDVPNPALSDPIRVSIENPFLPVALREIMQQNNLNTITMTKGGHDLGQRRFENTRDLYQVTAGFKGELPILGNMNYEIYYQHGESRSEILNINRLERRDNIALDAVLDSDGNIVCRASLPASDPRFVAGVDPLDRSTCVPRNPFGAKGGNSQEAIDFLMVPFVTTAAIKQDVFHASAAGELFGLPAGRVGFAAGVEYRRESSRSNPDVGLQLGLGFPGGIPAFPLAGSFDVKEIFGEVLIPVLVDAPLAEELNIEAAVRFADYNTIGKATTYKLGGDWRPVSDLRFRSALSRSVRAPNVGELFAPSSTGSQFVIDPCDPTNIDDQGDAVLRQNRINNCAQIVPAGFASFAELTQQRVLTAGNPDLNEEVARSLTVGAVLTPRVLPGLTLTVDYWRIRISEAVGRFPVNDILANCVDASSLNNAFCTLVERFPLSDPANAGQLSVIRSSNINVAELKASGVDLEAGYATEVAGGTLRVNMIATYLRELDFLADPLRPEEVISRSGQAGSPKLLGQLRTTYSRGPATLSWQTRYVGSSNINNSWTPETHDQNRISTKIYHNLHARYDVTSFLEVFVGVDNVLNSRPPQVPPRDIQLGIGQAGSLYDNRGAFYYGGASVRF